MCVWSDIPRISARVPGWVEKGTFLFSKARGVAPVSEPVSATQNAHVSLDQRCANPIEPQGAVWILKGGLWRKVSDSLSQRVSRSGASDFSQGLAEGFGEPSPLSCCCDSSAAARSTTTLSQAQDTLIGGNAKVLLKSHVARCRPLVEQNKLTIPGVSPEFAGVSRTGIVVKLGGRCACQEYQAWLRACRGILPLSLVIMATALEKEWQLRQAGSDLVSALMDEGDRWT